MNRFFLNFHFVHMNSLSSHFRCLGFFFAFNVYCLYKYVTAIFLQKPPFIVVPKERTFSLGSSFGPKSPFLTEVLVVLVLKIGGRALKGMRFQIENHRCGLYLRPGTFKEEIGQRSL